MARRLFSHNSALGITTYAHTNEDNDTITLEKVADEESLLEGAQAERNQFTSLDRMPDGMVKVATVPIHIWSEWLKDGRDKDQKFVRSWLNATENARYRTRKMRV